MHGVASLFTGFFYSILPPESIWCILPLTSATSVVIGDFLFAALFSHSKMQLNFLLFFLFFSCSSASSFIKICFALIHTTLASYGVNGKVVRLNQTLIPHFGKLPKVCCFFSHVGLMCLQSSHFCVCVRVFLFEMRTCFCLRFFARNSQKSRA